MKTLNEKEVLKLTPKKAIEYHCWCCIYDPGQPGTWRSQIEACPSVTCGLHGNRPITQSTLNKKRKDNRNA